MGNWNGAYSQKNPLNTFRTRALRTLSVPLEYVLLAGLGVLAVALHQALRFPMQLPGRHGIEWMALLIVGRVASRQRGAGSVVGVGAAAASLLPMWAAGEDPLAWLTYLIPGLLVDLAYAALPRWRANLVFLASLGGLTFATKPLLRWIVSLATGLPQPSLLLGLGYPLATHLLFGALGAFLGAVVALGVQKFILPPAGQD